LGEETTDALRSELIMIDPIKLNSLKEYINQASDKLIMSKLNAESKAFHTSIMRKIKRTSIKPEENIGSDNLKQEVNI
jgi:hypothetical protein